MHEHLKVELLNNAVSEITGCDISFYEKDFDQRSKNEANHYEKDSVSFSLHKDVPQEILDINFTDRLSLPYILANPQVLGEKQEALLDC